MLWLGKTHLFMLQLDDMGTQDCVMDITSRRSSATFEYLVLYHKSIVIERSPPQITGLWASDILGGLLWGWGFLSEAIADQQKYNFKQDMRNKGKFINTGNTYPMILVWVPLD